ncbi:hypothetical protein [Mycobacterium sp. 1245801.1]|uniref:hypothetical protein n=1 Tax=Mycobacterium sp. 1245801.1 TaxID=1834075 RepID=UPI0008002EDC|nr:hypothetical protein [Mycobacterium sp. 1245801.1]OBJ21604.1 hypothetical protein A5622_17160 [Mycobacterium sp. 1245801.1]
MPQNYYDAPATQIEFTSAQLNIMSSYGILYDADTFGGQFYHFFTLVIGDGIFFEVVQRIGKYPGYEEVNSASRLAAQCVFESHAQRAIL